jgi:hypothetical protein
MFHGAKSVGMQENGELATAAGEKALNPEVAMLPG